MAIAPLIGKTLASEHPLVVALEAAIGGGNTTVIIQGTSVGGRYRVRVLATPMTDSGVAHSLEGASEDAVRAAVQAVTAERLASGAEIPGAPATFSANGDATSAIVRAPPPPSSVPSPPPQLIILEERITVTGLPRPAAFDPPLSAVLYAAIANVLAPLGVPTSGISLATIDQMVAARAPCPFSAPDVPGLLLQLIRHCAP